MVEPEISGQSVALTKRHYSSTSHDSIHRAANVTKNEQVISQSLRDTNIRARRVNRITDEESDRAESEHQSDHPYDGSFDGRRCNGQLGRADHLQQKRPDIEHQHTAGAFQRAE